MTTDAVNHHADHPGFAGVTGLLFGLTMIVAGGAVARLAADLAAVSPREHRSTAGQSRRPVEVRDVRWADERVCARP